MTSDAESSTDVSEIEYQVPIAEFDRPRCGCRRGCRDRSSRWLLCHDECEHMRDDTPEPELKLECVSRQLESIEESDIQEQLALDQLENAETQHATTIKMNVSIEATAAAVAATSITVSRSRRQQWQRRRMSRSSTLASPLPPPPEQLLLSPLCMLRLLQLCMSMLLSLIFSLLPSVICFVWFCRRSRFNCALAALKQEFSARKAFE